MPLLFKNTTVAMSALNGETSGPHIDLIKSTCSAIGAVVEGVGEEDANQTGTIIATKRQCSVCGRQVYREKQRRCDHDED